MLLDELVSVIEILQRRIRDHGDSLRQNEIRTRTALIDPLLKALGWDVADPALVTPEYSVNGKRADYALLDSKGAPVVFLEAKRLDESLSNHLSQVVAYASELGIKYPAMTDGNKWEVYDNSKLVPIEQRMILNLSINSSYAHELALQLLLLWRPNLASGQPVAANAPIVTPASDQPNSSTPDPAVPPQPDTPNPQPGAPPSNEGWITLAKFSAQPGNSPPSEIRFSDNTRQPLKLWRNIPEHTAKWLWTQGILTHSNVPVSSSGQRYIVSVTPQHPSGNSFSVQIPVTGTPLFTEGNVSSLAAITNAKTLLAHCQQDPDTVWLKVD